MEYDISALRRDGEGYSELDDRQRALVQNSFAPILVGFDTPEELLKAHRRFEELVEDEKKRLKISQDVEVVLNKFHFTVSRKAQLIQKYRRWKTAFPNAPFGEVYENAKSAGDVIDTMEKILSSAVFGRPNS